MHVQYGKGPFTDEDKIMENFGSVSVEEHVHGDTLWVAVRARGAEWSWLTPEDALRLAKHWVAAYGAAATSRIAETATG
jgi:hypothetical protein